MKIAIIGGTGLLGSNLVKLLSNNYDVRSFSRNRASNVSDLQNYMIDFNEFENELTKHFDLWKPNIVINTVALVNLQLCENNYSLARYINCEIAVKLAKITKNNNIYFIHISTDHYYNDEYKIHNEKSKVNLLNNYADTKYSAEKEILKYNESTLIVRTNIIGFRRRNVKSFFEWLLNSLHKQEPIELYANFYTSPISVNELGVILIKCYENNLIGTYNIASKEVISKYDFGIKTARRFGCDIENITKSIIKNTESGSLKRGLTLGLDVSKIENALDIVMPTVDETLENLFNEYKEENE